MNDIELQRWLASQLPEKIYKSDDGFRWNNNWESVTPREWLYVVSLVEAKLTDLQHSKYGWTLLEDGEIECRGFLGATWQKRTRTLMEVLK